MYQEFREQGLCVIPLKRGIPLVEWSRYFYELPNGEASTWQGNEYGLVCGKVSNVIALDIDTDDPEGLRAYELAGETPVRKKGSKGFTAFYRYNGEKSCTWKRQGDKSPIVELLCDKRITTIPPSPHRKTGEIYEWLDKKLGDVELPAMRDDFITLMDALYPRPQRIAKDIVRYDNELEDFDLAQVEDMLDHISSDCPRDEWISIGMALRDEFGDAACNLFHRWSKKAASRYKHHECQAAWRSFTGSGVTLGTIVHKAKQAGWMARIEPEVSFAVDLAYINALGKKEETPSLEVHGLVGEIADWITSTAIRPQPVLSLAAALAFVGMVKGHVIEGKTGLRTNLLLMSLAPTGGGKEHPQSCLRRLIEECDLHGNLMGEPTSGTGYLRAINDRGRVVMMVMDEIGRFLSNIANKNSGGFQREIIDYIIKTFSSANSTLKGKEYADVQKNPTVDIIHPHFCCLGSTVLERFKDSCSSSEVIDGFLNRWLVMAVHDRGERRNNPDTRRRPPQGVIDKVKAISSKRDYDPYSTKPMMNVVKFSPEAWDVFSTYRAEMDDMVSEAAYPLNALYARCAEHVEKVALTICEGDMIHLSDVNAAIGVVKYSNNCIMDFADLISDNENEAEIIRVKSIIKDAGSISKSDLTRKTQFLKRIRRGEVMNDLVESGEVKLTENQGVSYFSIS